MYRITACLFAIAFAATPVRAAEAIVAVASNFLTTAERLASAFEAETDHSATLVHGSTGRLYAQIRAGAPFDLFLAADQERPTLLSDDGRAARQATYAIGQLVVVTRDAPDLTAALTGRRFAMADPEVAPYGAAARAALIDLGVSEDLAVYGDSVGQAASLFVTGNTEAAFLAASQVPDLPDKTVVFAVDATATGLAQDMVLIAPDNAAAVAFYDFLLSPQGQQIIVDAGYEAPK
ncbi:MAG: molybdate ABC transporter substrate-binding protein [Pseudomonadota bacterium]